MRPVLLAVVIALAGCAGAEDLARLRRMPLAGGDFAHTLAREYRTFAVQRSNNGGWTTAGHFAEKALTALAGDIPEPEPVDPTLEPALKGELERARARLERSLVPGAARLPAFAAVALARFDCWAERAPKLPDGTDAARCRREYEENQITLEEALGL
jgi:hypothetical protein